jgi:hypothetical protein
VVRDALVRNRIPEAYVVRSREESRPDGGWEGPCFTEVRRGQVAVRDLTLVAYRVGCAP